MRIALAVIAALAAISVATAWAAPGGAPGLSCDSIVLPGGSVSWHPTRIVLGVVDVPAAHIPRAV